MATAKEQLLSMMNPQQARLMDQQLRQQQVAQRAQGAGMLSGLVQAYTGMADTAQRATGIAPMGAIEMQAREKQADTKIITDAMSNAVGATRSERLLNAAENLEKSGNPRAIARAVELRDEAAKSKIQEEGLKLERQKVVNQTAENVIRANTAEARQMEAKNAADRIEADKVARQKQEERLNTETAIVYDSKGKGFKMTTKKTGDSSPVYTSLSGDNSQPEGDVVSESVYKNDQIARRQANNDFRKVFIEDRQNTLKALGDTKKVFNSAEKSYQLLKQLEQTGGTTGGIPNELLRQAKRAAGYADDEQVNLELLKKELGMTIATRLKEVFGGSQITDSERQFLILNMPSIDDSPEVIMRSLEATMEVSKSGVEKLTRLSKAKNYSEFTDIQAEYIEKDYQDVMERYDLLSRERPLEPVKTSQPTIEQLLIEKKRREDARNKQLQSTNNLGDVM